jgi:N-acetyl-gamma-glutamyl-phosphate reductase
MSESKKPIGIVGASGYGGVQLVKLLLEHPQVEIAYLGGDSSAGKQYSSIYPHLDHCVDLTVEKIDVDAIAERCAAVFLGLPNGLACDLAPALIAKGCKVLDLSADYRFSNLDTYTDWYKKERTDQDTAKSAVYGLPELFREQIKQAQLVGCPGCYPTASLLALSPLLKQGLLMLNQVLLVVVVKVRLICFYQKLITLSALMELLVIVILLKLSKFAVL